jgi:L-rhamnose mutarotase
MVEAEKAAAKFTNEHQVQALSKAGFITDNVINNLITITNNHGADAYSVLLDKKKIDKLYIMVEAEEAAAKFTNEHQVQALSKAGFITNNVINNLITITNKHGADAYSVLLDKKKIDKLSIMVDPDQAAAKFTNEHQVQALSKKATFITSYEIDNLVAQYSSTDHSDL